MSIVFGQLKLLLLAEGAAADRRRGGEGCVAMHLLQAGSQTASCTRILGMTARVAQDGSNLGHRSATGWLH